MTSFVDNTSQPTGEVKMRRLIISAIAVASLIGAISAASAGWFDADGTYHYVCYEDPYGYGYICF
jgi:hypothetical protein